jgi:predicted metalloprotease
MNTPRLFALALVAAALIAAGCGGGSPGAAARRTPSGGGHAIESPTVKRMKQVPAGEAAGRLPTPSSTKVHDPGLLHAAFASAESMWDAEFASAGARYQHAKLTFFHTTVRTQCGKQSRETGPFYCPPSHGVYLNTHFFDALAHAYGLRSGFAAGYITAHEVGHHVQQLLGVHERVALENRLDPGGANGRSVRVELQADCYAGVWLHAVSRAGELSHADVEDILRAATVVGDDFQRNRAGVDLAPETWTHGSSAQRVHWVTVGLERGLPSACDTFAPAG